jgi:nucleoside-diphosphate-sugar epimerase
VIFTITGANGFLGVHILHHLLSCGHTVRAVCRPNASLTEFEQVKSFYDFDSKIYTQLSWHACELYDRIKGCN